MKTAQERNDTEKGRAGASTQHLRPKRWRTGGRGGLMSLAEPGVRKGKKVRGAPGSEVRGVEPWKKEGASFGRMV